MQYLMIDLKNFMVGPKRDQDHFFQVHQRIKHFLASLRYPRGDTLEYKSVKEQ